METQGVVDELNAVCAGLAILKAEIAGGKPAEPTHGWRAEYKEGTDAEGLRPKLYGYSHSNPEVIAAVRAAFAALHCTLPRPLPELIRR